MLDLKMHLTSPAVAMQRTSQYQNLRTILGQQGVLKFPFCITCSSLVWSGVAFDRGPTHWYIRVLRTVFQVIELQACHRVFPPSRRDQDRERILVLPRLFALSHWLLPPLWCSWISAESPFRLSSNPFCSACALMLQSQTRMLVPLEILKWAPALPWQQKESKT